MNPALPHDYDSTCPKRQLRFFILAMVKLAIYHSDLRYVS